MPDDWLLEDEIVLFSTRRHVFVLLVPLGLVALATYFLVVHDCGPVRELSSAGPCMATGGAVALPAAALLILDWLATRLILTNRRVILAIVPVWIWVRYLWLEDIASVTVQIGLIGRVFRLGTLVVDSTATQGGRIALDGVPDPAHLRDRIAAASAARTL